MSTQKIPAEEKLNTVKDIIACKEALSHAVTRLSVSKRTILDWIASYQANGTDAFTHTRNKCYSSECKAQAVMAYLNAEGSQSDICKRFGLRSRSQLQSWIKLYNGHEELKASGTGGTAIMTKGRKTTFDERVEIVQYCIAHDRNYAETAEKYKVSYQQARSYTVKYEAGGLEALQDRRGKRKQEDSLSEVEKLHAELKLEKARRQRAEMEVSFLKKLEEIERRRG